MEFINRIRRRFSFGKEQFSLSLSGPPKNCEVKNNQESLFKEAAGEDLTSQGCTTFMLRIFSLSFGVSFGNVEFNATINPRQKLQLYKRD